MPDDVKDRLRGFTGFPESHSTLIPDVLFDDLLDVLTGGELKVLLYVARHTLGWKKDSDQISARQIAEGLVRKDGTHVDHGTGLSIRRVWSTVQRLEALGLVAVHRQAGEDGHERNAYSLRMTSETGGGSDARVTRVLTPESQGVVTPESPPKMQEQEATIKTQQQAPRPAKRGRQTTQAAPDPDGAVVVAPVSSDDETANGLAADLVAFGVAKTTARKIAGEHDPDAVRAYLRYVERLKAGGEKPRVSWAALLVAAIREGYVLPEEPAQAEGQRALLVAEERPLTAEEQAAGLAELEAFRAARQRGT